MSSKAVLLGIIIFIIYSNSYAKDRSLLARSSVSISSFRGNNLGEKLVSALNVVENNITIDCTSLVGNQYIKQQVEVKQSGITLLFGKCDILLSGVLPLQYPPGGIFIIKGDNFKFKGIRSETVLTLDKDCLASAFVLLQCKLSTLSNFTINGNKKNKKAQKDDTWGCGISMISYSEKQPKFSEHIIDQIVIENFIHYGIMLYGNTCRNNEIRNCTVRNNGNLNDIESTGSGICINKSSSKNIVENCLIVGNKGSGIFLCNAGGLDNSFGNKINGCTINNNEVNGILIIEQGNFWSEPLHGNRNVTIKCNRIFQNKESGIRIGTFDNVGIIENVKIFKNLIFKNGQYGVLLQGNNKPDSYTKNIYLKNNKISENVLKGVAISGNVLETKLADNTISDNVEVLKD